MISIQAFLFWFLHMLSSLGGAGVSPTSPGGIADDRVHTPPPDARMRQAFFVPVSNDASDDKPISNGF